MKNTILSFLKESTDYISGEYLSTKLNISRNAIWKHINTLKEEGYIIDSVRNKGYKLLSSPDLFFKNAILDGLNTKFLGQNLTIFKEIDSTNIYAKNICKKEPVNGMAILAETQNSGHGRFEREWKSPKGGLWNSIILTPDIEPIHAHKITLIGVSSMFLTLKSLGINPQIKWPNDIYLNNKKICGILTTMNCDMDKINYLIMGLGLNVNIDSSYFTENNLDTATSLKVELNKEFDRNFIVSEFYNTFEKLYLDFVNTLSLDKVITICRENSIVKNKECYVVSPREKTLVTCIDINENGELVVKFPNGEIKAVLSGEVTFK